MRVVQNLILRKILNTQIIPDYIYAFEKEKSIPLMAEMHTNRKLVISIDIKDFFTSIKQAKLFQVFQDMGFGEAPSRTLSELCTFKSYVPQGALTSPKISNIIAADTFGPLVKKYCDDKGFSVSIYADDITISMDIWEGQISDIINSITGFIQRFGFRVNRRKTKVMHYYNRQWVCGVVVNAKTNMIRKERLELRAIVHNISVNGSEAEAAKNDLTPGEFISRVQGRLNWFRQLNEPLAQKLINKLKVKIDAEKAAEIQQQQSKMVQDICKDESSLADSTLEDCPFN